MQDEFQQAINTISTCQAVQEATLTEMSKRLDEQYQSIKVLNDSHHTVELTLTELNANHKALSYRIDNLENNVKNTVKNWVTIIGIFITLASFMIQYLLT